MCHRVDRPRPPGSRPRPAAARPGPDRSRTRSSSSCDAASRSGRAGARSGPACSPASAASGSARFHSAAVAVGAEQRDPSVSDGGTRVVQRRGPPRRRRPAPSPGRSCTCRPPPRPGRATGSADGVLAGQLRGRLGLAGQQRPQAGVDALDVLAGERRPQHRVDVLEQVVDVGGGSPPGGPCPAYQSVSVVPMIQCRPQGMTNSTVFSVRRIIPVVGAAAGPAAPRGGCPSTRARGTARGSSASAWVSSVQTPVALITCLARTSKLRPVSRSRGAAPVTRSPSRRKPMTWVRLATAAP